MRNKKMLNKFKAFLACMCVCPQVSGVIPVSSETKGKKYSVVDELKTSVKQDAPIWLAGGIGVAGFIWLCTRCIPHRTVTGADGGQDSSQASPQGMDNSENSHQVPPPNYETSQYKVDHSKLNDYQKLDDIQKRVYNCINSLRSRNIDNFRWQYFENSIDQNIERIFVAMSKYFANEDNSNQILEIKNLINNFVLVMAKKDKSWEYYSLDNQANDTTAIGVAIEVGLKYIMRLVHIKLGEDTFKKGKNGCCNQKQMTVLNRLDNITDFNSILKLIDDNVYNMNVIMYGCEFEKICCDYKNLLETGKIN